MCNTKGQLCVGVTDGERADFSELLVKRTTKKVFWAQEKQIEGRKCITITAAIHPSPYFLRLSALAVMRYSLKTGFAAGHYSIVLGPQHLLLLHRHRRMMARSGAEEQYSCSEPDFVVELHCCRIDNGQAASEQTNFQYLSVCQASRKAKLASAVVDNSKHSDWLLSSYRYIPVADL
jgi:hypothetical protein